MWLEVSGAFDLWMENHKLSKLGLISCLENDEIVVNQTDVG
jgi:hypothetical protein